MKVLNWMSWIVVLCLGLAQSVTAQDLLIRNARIIQGDGNVIENATVTVRDGLIASVSNESAATEGAPEIDAGGMTVMPGFIDAHRHIIGRGDADQWMQNEAPDRMREYLDAGFTTILSAGDAAEPSVEIRDLIAAGEIPGPRIVVAGRVHPLKSSGGGPLEMDPARAFMERPPGPPPSEPPQATPPEEARELVRRHAATGVDAIKTSLSVFPEAAEGETLAAIADEAAQHDLMSVTHAVSVASTLVAIDAGTDYLVHTPVFGQLDAESIQKIAAAGLPMTSTLGVFAPTFDERLTRGGEHTGDDNIALFRDLGPYPMTALMLSSPGFANARLLWEAGITYAFGTDTPSMLPKDALRHELISLQLMFSNVDIVTMLTRNAAIAVGLDDTIGTIEAGKIADIVIIDGDPLGDLFDLLNVAVVIRSGEVVVDNR